jgi:hypothetical protein
MKKEAKTSEEIAAVWSEVAFWNVIGDILQNLKTFPRDEVRGRNCVERAGSYALESEMARNEHIRGGHRVSNPASPQENQ